MSDLIHKDNSFEEFMAWHGDQYGYFNLGTPHCQLRWEAWQESRKRLIVDIPSYDHLDGGYYCDGYGDAVEACERFIKDAGITIRY